MVSDVGSSIAVVWSLEPQDRSAIGDRCVYCKPTVRRFLDSFKLLP